MHAQKSSVNRLMQSYRSICLQAARYLYKAVLKVNCNGVTAVKQLFKATASITVWLSTRRGYQRACRRAGLGPAGPVPQSVPDHHPWPGTASPGALPRVLSAQPSSQHAPAAGASLRSIAYGSGAKTLPGAGPGLCH